MGILRLQGRETHRIFLIICTCCKYHVKRRAILSLVLHCIFLLSFRLFSQPICIVNPKAELDLPFLVYLESLYICLRVSVYIYMCILKMEMMGNTPEIYLHHINMSFSCLCALYKQDLTLNVDNFVFVALQYMLESFCISLSKSTLPFQSVQQSLILWLC